MKAHKSKIRGCLVHSKESYRLIVTNQYAELFSERIGFQNTRKQTILDERIKKANIRETEPLATIIKIGETDADCRTK